LDKGTIVDEEGEEKENTRAEMMVRVVNRVSVGES